MQTRFLDGIAPLADRYDGFVLDQWGVLHDGRDPLPGALESVRSLRRAGKAMVLLSNSGQRRHRNLEQLARIGFDPGLFTDIVTSGETAWRALRERDIPGFERLGRRCLMSRPDPHMLDGLPIEPVASAADADFVLLNGVDNRTRTLESYDALVEAAVVRELPVVCINPDVIGLNELGPTFGPGAVAERVIARGGRVIHVGKPHAPVYHACLRALAPIPRQRILAVGDSPEHDIAGAAGQGLDSAFVYGGIHAEAFRDPDGMDEALEALVRRYGARPTYVIPGLG
jgi:HAD superfamily hydrolase (TIGR01459 family)